MSVNQHNMSLEVMPLQFLYTKYAPQAKTLSCGVRPLGIVHAKPSSSDKDILLSFSNLEEISDVERVGRFLAMSQEATNTDMYLEKSPNSVTPLPDVSNGSGLSRTQAFENKYKLVASRTSLDYKHQTNYTKRVIQLPMLKINLETPENDKTEPKPLETARKSLRKIIDVGRNATKAAGIVNYQFKTPGQSLIELNSCMNSPVTSVRTNKSKRGVFNHEPSQENDISHSMVNKGDLELESVNDEKLMIPSKTESTIVQTTHDSEEERYSDSDDDRASIMANRLSSAATLGSTRALSGSQSFDDSCGSEKSNSSTEVTPESKKSRSKASVNEVSFELPSWPSQDIVKTPVIETNNGVPHTYFQKPKIAKQKTPRIATIKVSDNCKDNLVITNGGNDSFPKLKYTLTASKTKLNPITVAPRYCMDCPICNLFQHKETTPCPPNSPRTDGDRANTTHTHQPFNNNVLSEIDLSANVDSSICDSSSNFTGRCHTSRENSVNACNLLKKRRSVEHANPNEVSSQYRFGYIESRETFR